MSVQIINLSTGQSYDFHNQHGHVTLACWCAPKRCHCEIIKQWVLKPW